MPPRDFPAALSPDPIEAITRRRLLTALPVLGLMAAGVSCNDDSDSGESSDTWTYENEFGTAEIPRNLERIVSIDYFTPPILFDLGVAPVGLVNEYLTSESIPPEYREAAEESGARAVSNTAYWDTDIEAVAAEEPDLIFATADMVPVGSPERARFEQIAPVVALPAHTAGSWVVRCREIARILDREDEMDRQREEYEAARDEVRERYAALLDEMTFANFVPRDDQWSVAGTGSYSAEILLDLGTHFIDDDVPEIALDEAGANTWLAYEHLELLNGADIILWAPTAEAAFNALTDNPVGQTLPAVQQGRVFRYIDYAATGSYRWAMKNLRDIEQLLGEIQTHIDAQ